MTLADFGAFLLDQHKGEVGKGKLLRAKTYRELRKPTLSLPPGQAPRSQGYVFPFQPLPNAGVAHYFIAGLNLRMDHRQAMVVTAIPEGQNRLLAIDRSLRAVTSSLPRPK